MVMEIRSRGKSRHERAGRLALASGEHDDRAATIEDQFGSLSRLDPALTTL
jgi:hypothetical protein